MRTFIQEYVDDLSTRQDMDWSKLVVVVPNKLVGFYVQKALRQVVSASRWSPRILTIPELASQMADCVSCSSSRSMMYLMDAYVQEMPSHLADLEHFMLWGQKLHNDFLDVAMSLADAKQIYRDLRSVKEVEHWGIGDEFLSETQKAYLVFWNALEGIYESWKAIQEKDQQMVYPVMLRYLLNNERKWSDQWKGSHIDVVGIAGFQKAEEMMLQMLGRIATLRVIWDADRYYIFNDWHEAGATIRKHAVWLNRSAVPDHLTSSPIHINHVLCDSFHGQCAAIARELSRLPLIERSNAAILLPDETWLHPVIHFLAGADLIGDRGYEEVNGFSTVMRWITVMIRVHNHRLVQTRGYFVRDLLEILDLSRQWLLPSESVTRLQSAIRTNSKGYWASNNLKEIGWFDNDNDAWNALFFNASGVELMQAMQQAINNFLDKTDERVTTLLETLEQIEMALNVQSINGDFTAMQWLWRMARGQLSSSGIRNRDGEVQVLLMTDTRALDFKYIFIPGLNEGVVPKKSSMDSFVPLDIRTSHGMSLPADAEASYAYVFYRIMQRASACTFFSASVDLQKRDQEVSRFLIQIQSELMPANSAIEWKADSFRLAPEAMSTTKVPLNNAWSRARIDAWLEAGISASAINKYIDCPLDFYFKYIAKIGEPDELEETISDSEMGSLVHLVLERFYKAFIGSYPTANDFDLIIGSIDQWLDDAIDHSNTSMDLTTGDNALVRGIAKKMLMQYLQFEKRTIETEQVDRCIVGVEVDFDFVLDVASGIRMRGKIDRLERVGQTYRVLDYKTGKVEEKDHVLKSKKNAPLFPGQSGKMVQIITYMLALPHIVDGPIDVQAGFISFRHLDRGWRLFDAQQAGDWASDFKAYIVGLVSEMKNSERWEHDGSAKYCSYCQTLGFEQQQEEEVEEATDGDAS
jgi:ATP-dependent helicase/nuclease subunit B